MSTASEVIFSLLQVVERCHQCCTAEEVLELLEPILAKVSYQHAAISLPSLFHRATVR